jgi:heme exporter protein D
MNWSSVADFIAMGGYGLYVWGAFGVTAVVMVGEVVSLRARRKALREPRHAPHELGSEPAARTGFREGAA